MANNEDRSDAALHVDEDGVTWAGGTPIAPPPGAVQHYFTTQGLGWMDKAGLWHFARAGYPPTYPTSSG